MTTETPAKTCNACRLVKPPYEFTVRRASPDGLALTCRSCSNARSAEWRQAHPGAHADWYRKHRAHKAEYWARWYPRNASARSKTYAAWARANPGIVNARTARRRTAASRPVGADRAAIAAIYREAARLTRETGIRHEVDHIYPLQGRTVSGLHVAHNLQILTKADNQRKRNRMPTHAATLR